MGKKWFFIILGGGEFKINNQKENFVFQAVHLGSSGPAVRDCQLSSSLFMFFFPKKVKVK
jgi:hypothetical protein